MTTCTYYEPSGKISHIYKGPTEPCEIVGLQIVDGEFQGDEYYVLDGAAAVRPTMPITIDKSEISANCTDVATISGVPVGAAIRCRSNEAVSDGSSIEFSTDTTGNYVIAFELFPYLDSEVVVNAI